MEKKRVTREEAEDWRGAYEDGMTIEEIALYTGWSNGTVQRWLRKVGTQMRPPSAPGQSQSYASQRGDDSRSHRKVSAYGNRRQGHRRARSRF